jgi:replicative superfamily II helicase
MANQSSKRKLRKVIRTDINSRHKVDEDDVVELDFSHLREDYKRNRERFCREYIKDFHGTNAMLRLYNCQRNTAQVKASQWLEQPYTQWFLSKLIEEMDADAIVTQNEIVFGLKREAHQTNSQFADSATRIAALRALAKIKGMEKTTLDGEVKLGGGVMVVPGLSAEDWKKKAKASQAALKQEVRK